MKRILITIVILLSITCFGQNIWFPATGTDTYSTNIPNFGTNYTNKIAFVKFTNTNTGASTININSLGAVALRMWDGDSWEALTASQISTTTVYRLSHTGSYFTMIGASSGGGTWGSITGTLSDQTDLQTALNAKQNTLTLGNLTTPTTGVSITGGTGAVVGSGAAISIQNASTSQTGLLTNTDWNTFNGKQSAITFGTGVQTALGVNIGSAGAPVVFNGAGGTPSSMTGTNITGIPLSTAVTGILPIANGGSGQSTANDALNAFLPTQGSNSGKVLTTDGSNSAWQTSSVGQIFSFNNQTGTSYTLVLSDAGKLVTSSNASAQTITIPPNSSVAFQTGTIIYFERLGVGQLTIAAGAGVTITASNSVLTDPDVNIIFYAIKTGTDAWTLQNGKTSDWSTWSPTYTGFSADPSGGVAKYVLNGKSCTIWLQRGAGTSNATTMTFTLPFASEGVNVYAPVANANGTQQMGRLQTTAGSNVVTCFATVAAGAWSSSGAKDVQISGWTYKIQ